MIDTRKSQGRRVDHKSDQLIVLVVPVGLNFFFPREAVPFFEFDLLLLDRFLNDLPCRTETGRRTGRLIVRRTDKDGEVVRIM